MGRGQDNDGEATERSKEVATQLQGHGGWERNQAREPRRADKGNIWEHLSLWGFADGFRFQRTWQTSSGVREEGRRLREGGQSHTGRRQGSGGD